jgi:hypothetical protein
MSAATALTVNRQELAQGLQLLHKFVRTPEQLEAVFSFGDGLLSIQMDGMTVSAAAEGGWNGEARVSSIAMLSLAGGLPEADPLRVWVEENRLHVGSFSAPCVWQESGGSRIDWPINPSLSEALRLRFHHTDEEIARSGLASVVEAAEREQDRRIAQAAAILVPLGVGAADLRRMVDESLKKAGSL